MACLQLLVSLCSVLFLFVVFKLHPLFWAGESWRDSVWFHTQAGNQSRLLQEQRGAEEKDEEDPL